MSSKRCCDDSVLLACYSVSLGQLLFWTDCSWGWRQQDLRNVGYCSSQNTELHPIRPQCFRLRLIKKWKGRAQRLSLRGSELRACCTRSCGCSHRLKTSAVLRHATSRRWPTDSYYWPVGGHRLWISDVNCHLVIDDVSVNDGPHTRRWSHNIITLPIFFTFIVAPCISMIQLFSHTNLCTCIYIIKSLKHFSHLIAPTCFDT
jgi:hypothetical protein